jgi:hypothetical protein
MNSIRQIFRFHPIGQGLFYSGVITGLKDERPKAEFKFVFDVGTKSSPKFIEDEIKTFHDQHFPDGSVLDMLVISHFDSDHCSHVHELLKGTRRVRRIVVPFLPFEERLYLALGGEESPDDADEGTTPLDAAYLLNPLNALRERLSEDGEIWIVTSDPSEEGFEYSVGDDSTPDLGADTVTVELSLAGVDPSETERLAAITDMGGDGAETRYRVVSERTRSQLAIGGRKIMEFQFYRKPFTHDGVFFSKLKEAFYNEYFPGKSEKEVSVDDLATVIKEEFRSSAKLKSMIESMYEKGIRKDHVGVPSVTELKNLNTTALCMMHRNMQSIRWADGLVKIVNHSNPSIYKKERWTHYKFSYNKKEWPKGENTSAPSVRFKIITTSKEIRSLDPFEIDLYSVAGPQDMFWECYPNTLLTSDIFLIDEQEEIDPFRKRFGKLLPMVFLFQIPHHGSGNNSDEKLYRILPAGISTIVNHGSTSSKNPAKSVLDAIDVCGHTKNIHHATELIGLCLEDQFSW